MEIDTVRKQKLLWDLNQTKVLKWLRMQQLDNCQATSYRH